MDKNFVIGLVLIMLMLIGYQVLVPKPVEPTPVAEVKKEAAKPASVTSDTTHNSSQSVDSTAVPQKDLVIETKDARVVFTNKGGVMKEVMLKNYKTYDQKPLFLIAENHNKFQIDLPTQTGDVRLTNQFFTTDAQDRTLAEGDSAVITYRTTIKNNQTVEQTYVVRGTGYVIDYGIKASGALPANKAVEFHWDNDLLQLENDMKKNREVVTVNYYTDELKSLPTSPTSNEEEKTADPVKWFTIKHKYFLAGLIAEKTPLTNVTMRANVNPEDSVIVKNMNIFAGIPTAAVQKGANFQFYLGPNEYHIVDKVKAENFDQNVYLGYAFLKPINKFVLVPLFNLLEGFVSNYGLLIILLVLFVKTLLTPLTYKSYISMAKMRILGPELEQIREQNKDDLAKQQQEQMKLYQQVGVSPLSGCVPVLATMPILFSLFFLFPNLIELRQQSFLWASDLSTYDSFFKLPFNVPFGIGNHISLFTILMTISSIGYAYYNNQNTPTQPGPVNMKALGYVMPLMFMFILNSFPAGLTFYYFVSNVVTIAQQLLIKRFVNEDKIKNILEENRKKNATGEKKQNKFQKYLEKSLQAAEEAKKKQAELEKKTKKK